MQARGDELGPGTSPELQAHVDGCGNGQEGKARSLSERQDENFHNIVVVRRDPGPTV